MKGLEEDSMCEINLYAKKILVTGGAGFIGSHLCEKLLELGGTVINIDSLNDFYDVSIKKNNLKTIKEFCRKNCVCGDRYIFQKGDIRDLPFLERIFTNYEIDTIIHLAAYAGVRSSIENPGLYMDVNINGTLNLLEYAKKFSIKSFIFASSSSVYGDNSIVPFSETQAVDNPISPYAASKKAGELICYTYHSLYGINIACLRFFTVFGPRQRPDLAIYKFTKLLQENREIPFWGDGTTERDYTYITDILDGIINALLWVNKYELRYDIFNLGESNAVSLGKMISTLEEVTGKKARLNKLPLQPGDVLRTYADISKSKRVLGYNPTVKFDEGIKMFYDWYCRNCLTSTT